MKREIDQIGDYDEPSYKKHKIYDNEGKLNVDGDTESCDISTKASVVVEENIDKVKCHKVI